MELLPPIFADGNGLCLPFLVLRRVALTDGMVNEQLDVLRLVRVDHVEHVLAVHIPSFGQFVWEVSEDVFVSHHQRPDVANRQLIIKWHTDALDVVQTK